MSGMAAGGGGMDIGSIIGKVVILTVARIKRRKDAGSYE